MEKTYKPTVAGILNIVAGVFSLLGSIGVIVGIMALGHFMIYSGPGPVPVPDFGSCSPQFVYGFIQPIMWIAVVFLLIVGILPIIGGIYALQRKKWGLALTGSIAAIFGSLPLGIAATVFTAISKDEFK